MKITSFDELQREITRITSEFKRLVSDYTTTKAVREVVQHLDKLNNLRISVAQLWIDTLGALYSKDYDETTRYCKRVRKLENELVDEIKRKTKYMTGLARAEANRLRMSPPYWFGELSAHIKHTSMRGYWTYGLDPMSVMTDSPKFDVYWRIDIYNAEVFDNINWSNLQSAPRPPVEGWDEKQISDAVNRGWDLSGVGGYYTTNKNMSIWVTQREFEEAKRLNKRESRWRERYFQSAITSIEALHPSTSFCMHYSIKDLMNVCKFVQR